MVIELTARREPEPGEELVADWLLWMQARGMSYRTIGDRVAALGRVSKASDVPPDVLSSRQILAFLARAQISQSTRSNYHSILTAWFTWCLEEGHVVENPMARVPRPKVPRRRPRPIETQHLEKLINSRMHQRTRTMILLCAYQGLRVHEVAKFRGEDVDRLGGRLYVKGKGGVDEWLPLHPAIAEEATRYPTKGFWFTTFTGNHRESVSVLPASVSSIISIAMARAGVPGTAHSLRHWYGTQLVRSGADLRTAQTLLRHASLQTTQIYVEIGEDRRSDAIGHLPTVNVPGPPRDRTPR